MTHDRVGADQFVLTHEFVAVMLGVRRATVTLVANTFQRAGFIKYARGVVAIVNRQGLKEASCECYDLVTRHYEEMLPGSLTGTRASQLREVYARVS